VVLPGDPAMMMLGEQVGSDSRALRRAARPAWPGSTAADSIPRLGRHAGARRFRNSLRDHLPIGQSIVARVAPTLELAVLGMILALMVSIPVGIISALKPGSFVDMLATLLALSGVAVPALFLGILLIELFAASCTCCHRRGTSRQAKTWAQTFGS